MEIGRLIFEPSLVLFVYSTDRLFSTERHTKRKLEPYPFHFFVGL